MVQTHLSGNESRLNINVKLATRPDVSKLGLHYRNMANDPNNILLMFILTLF